MFKYLFFLKLIGKGLPEAAPADLFEQVLKSKPQINKFSIQLASTFCPGIPNKKLFECILEDDPERMIN